MVGDIFMPLISAIIGNVDFSNLYLVLTGQASTGAGLEDAKKTAVVLGWGNFITHSIKFMIVAAALFMVVKGMNKLKKNAAEAPAAPSAPTKDQELLTEIRDLLRNKP